MEEEEEEESSAWSQSSWREKRRGRMTSFTTLSKSLDLWMGVASKRLLWGR